MTQVNVKTIAEVQGKEGQPQWELKVQWPWTVANNQDTVWLDQSNFDKPVLGAQSVVVNRRYVKSNKTKEKYNGTKDWMWNWDIIEFGIDGDTPPNPAVTKAETAGAGSVNSATEPPVEHRELPPAKDAIQTRIEIGMAFNAAYTLIAGDHIIYTNIYETLRETRDRIYHEVILVPIVPAATPDPSPGKDVHKPVGTTPGKCAEHNNAPFIGGTHPVHDANKKLLGWCYEDGPYSALTPEGENPFSETP